MANIIYYSHKHLSDEDYAKGNTAPKIYVRNWIERKKVYKITGAWWLTPKAIAKLERKGFELRQYMS